MVKQEGDAEGCGLHLPPVTAGQRGPGHDVMEVAGLTQEPQERQAQ